jgi:predicted secreted protein
VRTDSNPATDADEVDGLNDIQFNPTNDLIETTATKNNDGSKTRMYGLGDSSFSVSGFLMPDAPQKKMRTACFNKTEIWVTYKPNKGAVEEVGYHGKVLVESCDMGSGVEDANSFSASMSGSGAVALL